MWLAPAFPHGLVRRWDVLADALVSIGKPCSRVGCAACATQPKTVRAAHSAYGFLTLAPGGRTIRLVGTLERGNDHKDGPSVTTGYWLTPRRYDGLGCIPTLEGGNDHKDGPSVTTGYRLTPRRYDGLGCIPTLERGNDHKDGPSVMTGYRRSGNTFQVIDLQ